MANQEQFDILKQGVEVWNQWRIDHSDIRPDLNGVFLGAPDRSRATLNSTHLHSANLSHADLTYSKFYHADLSGADLSHADLTSVDLICVDLGGANLRSANLKWANLGSADLHKTDLSSANLFQANLGGAIFDGTILSGASLAGARFIGTVFSSVNLNDIKGLDTAYYAGPSTVNLNTVILPHEEHIRLHFLRGVGFTETQIEYLPSFLTPRPIEYHSLFISYAHQDEVLAQQLHTDLRKNNVPCWFAPEDLKIGEKFWHRIDESINLYDKLLVVLSQHSVESEWVEREVMAALEKERQQQRLVLFPITLDEAFKHTFAPWTADLRRQRHIGDFTCWKDHHDYHKAFARLLRDLKAEANKTEP